MCGISGYIGKLEPGFIQRMNHLQSHRGPDGFGVFEDPDAGVALGHVRLSILDLSDAAAQPMVSESGRYVIIFNGEIYNFKELRTELETRFGCRFRSTGDTEVLLEGLARFGSDYIRRLDGIFAFALWDREQRTLLIARDPVGVKPLYYCEPKPGGLLFASEIKALFAYPALQREPNFQALQEHLARGHASGTHTAFKHIFRLGPGMTLRWDEKTRKIAIEPYWQPSFNTPDSTSYQSSLYALQENIRNAVEKQMVSDVPVGSFLSGGLDSTLITLLAANTSDQDFQCFTITYPSSENILDRFVEDTPYAFRISQNLKKTHVMINIKPDVASLLQPLLWHMDEPIADPAIIASYLISQYARRNGTIVMLSGQGADELFGGYPRYQAMDLVGKLNLLPAWMRKRIATTAAFFPAALEGRYGAMLRRLRRVMIELNEPTERRFMAYCSANSDDHIGQILHPEIRADLQGRSSADKSLEIIRNCPAKNGNRYLYRDFVDYLPNHNLLYMDKMSMAVGVESRVPLLDMALVEQVTSMPFSWKVSGMNTKRILRDAAMGIVPNEIIYRSKAGFGAPYRKWLRYDLQELWEDITSDASVRRRGWFDVQGLRNIRSSSQSGSLDLYMLQWAVMTVELWARTFFDGDPTEKP